MISNFIVNQDIAKYLNASFWVTMMLGDGSKNSVLRADAIKYKIYNDNHEPIPFWQNTQTLIYRTVNEKASLMSLLFSTLNNKRSMHVLSEISSQQELSIDVQINEYDDISVNIIFPSSFIEQEQFDYTTICFNNLKDIIDIGYNFAKDHFISNESLERIRNVAEKVSNKLKILLPDEDPTHLFDLSLVSIAYIYPTSRFCGKSFSTVLCKFRKDDHTEVSSGGLFLLWNNISVSSINNIIQNDIYFLRLRLIANQFCSDVTTSELLKQSQKESIKSAKAAIMSRNMSHNLGSHVMAYLKHHLGSAKDMLDKKVLYSLVPEILNKQVDLKKIAETTEMPFLVGLGRFIGYLQERQDYIATVATDYIPYIAPVNLKDAIYDELNPDLRYARHNDTDDKNRPSNILLKYIAKSEGLSREEYNSNETNDHDIRIGFKGYKDGVPLKTTFGEYSVDESMTVLRQINLGLPGGLIGRQAIFSIIENIIRNAAKHGVFNGQDKSLELIIDVIDGLDIQRNMHDVFKDRIFDEEIFNLFKGSTDIKNLQVITITDNLQTSVKVIDNQRRALNENYLDEGGKMKNANKGMKEMRISAAWLRNYTDEDSYSKMSFTDEQGVLHEAVCGLKAPLFACERTEDGNLRYLFCVSKCRKAIIVKDSFTHDPTIYGILEQMTINTSDWEICTKDELLENDFNKSAEFILVSDEDIYMQIRPLLSNRVVKFWTITDSQKQMILKSNEDAREKTLLRVIYQLYSGMKSADTHICIVDSSPGYQSYFEGIKIWDNERNAESAKYVYRKHHATENDFLQYWRKRFRHESFTAAQCVEGITGNNSSDRLVRREPLDEKWYYLHLNAMKRRIAILDERIFNNEHKVDDKQFFTGDTALLRFIEKNRIFLQSCPLEDAISKVNDELSDILPADCLDDIYYVDSNEEVMSLIDKFAYKEQTQSANNYRSIYQHERGVDIFTILKTRDGWGIYGCCKYGIDEDCLCEYGKIAEISFDGDNFMISTCGESVVNYKSRYEYISIHQGLLDKLYEGFNCKNDNSRKLKLTCCLYEFFGSDSPIGEYLPNFIIHSGRSKPTEYDMPQKQPFVQYAAIENGVKDCKYSLVELLDYARYE